MQGNWAWDRRQSDSTAQPWQELWEKYDHPENTGGSWEQVNNGEDAPYVEFENIMHWDDSGALEAYQIAMERHQAQLRGLTFPIPLPDPELYNQTIHWDIDEPLEFPDSGDILSDHGNKMGQRKRGRKGGAAFKGSYRGNKQFNCQGYADSSRKNTRPVSKTNSNGRWDVHNYNSGNIPSVPDKTTFHRDDQSGVRAHNPNAQYYSHIGCNDASVLPHIPSAGRLSQADSYPQAQAQWPNNGKYHWVPQWSSSQQNSYKWQPEPATMFSATREWLPSKHGYPPPQAYDLTNNHFVSVMQSGQYPTNRHHLTPQSIDRGNYMPHKPCNVARYNWDSQRH